jgi:hypothetical protein
MKVHLFLTLGLALGLVLVVMVAVPSIPVQADPPCTRYVLGIDTADNSDCSDEAHPCKTIQYAIDQAVDGDVICIADHMLAPGPTIYAETLLVTRTLTLDGKWEGMCVDPSNLTCAFSPIACAPAPRVVIDAAGLGRSVTILGPISPTIDCLTLTGGDAEGLGGDPDGYDAGGAIFSEDAAPIVVNSVISGNYACDACLFDNGRGGGLYLLNAPSTTIIRDNLIANNVAGRSASAGGGIAVRGGAPAIIHNHIFSNTAASQNTGQGGGLYFEGIGPTTIVSGNIVEFNIAAVDTTGDGGGYYIDESNTTLNGGRVEGNYGSPNGEGRGGGLFLNDSTALVSSAIISDNISGAGGLGKIGRGGGAFISNTLATLVGNQFISNQGDSGGGVEIFKSDNSRLLDNLFDRNDVIIYGGAIFLQASDSVTLTDNILSHNSAHQGGGGYILHSDGVLFEANTIIDNEANGGSGLYLYDSLSHLDNNVIADNPLPGGPWAAALHVHGDTATLRHNTIARNLKGIGVLVSSYWGGDGLAVMTNTILVKHEVGISVTVDSTATLEATLWATGTWANGTDWVSAGSLTTGTVNIWNDPGFVDPTTRDYHITSASFALDAGVETGLTTDIDGHFRPFGAAPDIGADELLRIYLPLVLRQH